MPPPQLSPFAAALPALSSLAAAAAASVPPSSLFASGTAMRISSAIQKRDRERPLWSKRVFLRHLHSDSIAGM